MRLARLTFVVCICLVGFATVGLNVNDPPGKQLKTFAESFLSTLTEAQKSVAMVAYDSPQRVDWRFVPMKTRKGLVLRKMNTAQRTAALRLVRAALSEAGYDKASKVMMLEEVLRQLEGEGRKWERDSGKYFLTLFGTPSNEGRWGFSFEGHHLSLNFVCRDGVVVDSTPQFFASNPATIMNDVEGPLGKGTRVLRLEEDLAFQLINSLDDDQRTQAVIAAQAPREIRFAGKPQAQVGPPEGISPDELNGEQKELLRQLVEVYVGAVADGVADERRQLIEHHDWSNVHFAWAGATEPGIGHYYRIRGVEFLIEFVNTQPDAAGNPANHIHCVFRDLGGDFDLPVK